jgi:hypothetical protein
LIAAKQLRRLLVGEARRGGVLRHQGAGGWLGVIDA